MFNKGYYFKFGGLVQVPSQPTGSTGYTCMKCTTWVGMEVPCTEKDKLLFAACTMITLGNRQKTAFWNSAWLAGQRPKDLAPLLFAKTRRKKHIVAEALQGSSWIRDLKIREGFTTAHLLQLVNLWLQVSSTQLQHDREDSISWNLTAHHH
jgi:hypothetical protein